MKSVILENFVLLEIQNIKLRDIKEKINSSENSSEINLSSIFEKLTTNWNKTYKKFGHLILSLINNINRSKDLSEEINKILEALIKFDKYYNTSSLKERISGIEHSLIDVTLEEIEAFLSKKENEESLLKRDKMSLQEILDLCKPLSLGKTFTSEEYDLIACEQEYLIVKPKTPKASVAWSMSDPNGNLERYGKDDIPKDAKPPWCTSIYSSDQESNNEFYHYFLNQYKTLYYVIKRQDYSFNDPFRKVSIGVDDRASEIEFDDAISVNSDNDFIRSEGEFIGHFRNFEASKEILNIIKEDTSRSEYFSNKKRREDLDINHINILFENRFKSFAARSKLQYFIQKSGDISLLINILNMYINSLKDNDIARDERDTSDIIRTLFDVKAFLNNLTFSPEEQSSIKNVIELKSSSIVIDLLDCIKILIESSKSNLIDDSIVPILHLSIQKITVNYILSELRIIIDLIKEKNILSQNLIDRLYSSLNRKSNLIDTMKRSLSDHSNVENFKTIINREVYKLKIRDINRFILKNQLLFKTEVGLDLIDKIFFKKDFFVYFKDCYESIVYNLEFKNYSRIEELVNLYVEDKFLTHVFLEVYGTSARHTNLLKFMTTEENLTRYMQKVYDFYKDERDEHAKEIIEFSDDIINSLRLHVVE